MIITVDLANPKPVYLQIADAVRRAIAVGSLQAGDRLPPIRETAVQTRVNRNTVGRAYLELEHQGLVQARQGSGFYVTDGGAERERSVRQEALQAQVRELVVEARLSRTSLEQLVRMVRECAETLDSEDGHD
jgi:GntR family transcriptional regulator